MFGAVAPKYDFLNRLLSAGRDKYWRKVAVSLLSPNKGERFLDLATGTGDIALEIASRHPSEIKVMGIDIEKVVEREKQMMSIVEFNIGLPTVVDFLSIIHEIFNHLIAEDPELKIPKSLKNMIDEMKTMALFLATYIL